MSNIRTLLENLDKISEAKDGESYILDDQSRNGDNHVTVKFGDDIIVVSSAKNKKGQYSGMSQKGLGMRTIDYDSLNQEIDEYFSNKKSNSDSRQQQSSGNSLLDFAQNGKGGLASKANAKPMVKQLQTSLNELGIDAGPADGIYGRKTANAVRTFQKTANIKQDGDAGPSTIPLIVNLKGFKYSGGTYSDFVNDLTQVEQKLSQQPTSESTDYFRTLVNRLSLIEESDPELKNKIQQLRKASVNKLPPELLNRLKKAVMTARKLNLVSNDNQSQSNSAARRKSRNRQNNQSNQEHSPSNSTSRRASRRASRNSNQGESGLKFGGPDGDVPMPDA